MRIDRLNTLLLLFNIIGLSLSLQFTSLAAPRNDSEITGSEIIGYHCPPCGCCNDELKVPHDGKCTACGMGLVRLHKGFKAQLDGIVSPMLIDDSLGKFYTKLIYPLFAVGIMFSLFILVYSFRGRSLSVYLVAIILAISLFGFKNQMFGVNYGLTSTYKSLFIPISFILLIGPLIYFYIKELIDTSFKWNRKYYFHFLPAALMFLYYLSLLVLPEKVKLQFMFSPFEVLLSHFEQGLAVILGLIYLSLSFRIFRKWQAAYSARAGNLNSWIIRFLTGMTSMLVVWGTIIFFNFWLYDFGVATVTYNPLWVWMGIVLVWFSIEIILNSKFFLINKMNNGYKVINDLELTYYENRLNEIMARDKLFANPDLSLDLLAAVLKINPRYLSTILNNALGKSFYDFINFHRIQEVKLLLKDPGNKNLTIEAIAYIAGFKSKSSFNSAFKKYTRMTPREFMKLEMVA